MIDWICNELNWSVSLNCENHTKWEPFKDARKKFNYVKLNYLNKKTKKKIYVDDFEQNII